MQAAKYSSSSGNALVCVRHRLQRPRAYSNTQRPLVSCACYCPSRTRFIGQRYHVHKVTIDVGQLHDPAHRELIAESKVPSLSTAHRLQFLKILSNKSVSTAVMQPACMPLTDLKHLTKQRALRCHYICAWS